MKPTLTLTLKAILSVFLAIFAIYFISPINVRAFSNNNPFDNVLSNPVYQLTETGEEPNVMLLITAVIGLLLIASLVGIITKRLRIPYTVGLVLIGLALSLRGQENFEVPADIFLGLLVPPLIFEAAFHIKLQDIRKDIALILVLAVPGVLITTLLVGGVVALGTGFPLAISLVFGSLVAATDPVAVVALFRSLGVPKRLLVLLEGESLFNDGTAIVLFNLMVIIAVTGFFDPLESIVDFIIISGGGFIAGIILGILIAQAIRFLDDPMIVTTLTTVLAFGSYIVAEQFHVSGVLAVVGAGLVSGNIGPRGMSPSTRIFVFNFWDYAAFIANSVVFLLIGMQINLPFILSDWDIILWAILAVLVSRAVTIYGLSWIGKEITIPIKNVLYWGGLRGAISLALAISLPPALGDDRHEIKAMAFGVVLFTLLVQGLSMKPLINKMALIQKNEAQEEYERRHARSVMAKTAFTRLEELYNEGIISDHIWKSMSAPLHQHAQALADAVSESLNADPSVEEEVFESAIREMLISQRSAVNKMLRDGTITEETYSQLTAEVDTALNENQTNQAKIILSRARKPIESLMAIIIQDFDVENVIAVLNRLGTPITRLTSSGGFLGKKNNTLLVGVSNQEYDVVIDAIKKTSKSRTELIPGFPDSSENDRSVTLVGANIFQFEVEHYEEF